MTPPTAIRPDFDMYLSAMPHISMEGISNSAIAP
jgi:hypothetical protein